jgi:hypothetical protein
MSDSTTTETTWWQLCPQGAVRYYEGSDPEGFRAEIKDEYGFDVADEYDPGPGVRRWAWGEWLETEDGQRFQVFAFFCPPEHIDAIYGSDRWPLGS